MIKFVFNVPRLLVNSFNVIFISVCYDYMYIIILIENSRVPNKRTLICLIHYSDNRCEYLISMKISICNYDDFMYFRCASSVDLANYRRGCVRNCLWMNAQGQRPLLSH